MMALRFMLPLVLLLIGAVVGIGCNLEDDVDLLFLHGQTDFSRPNAKEKAATPAVVSASSARPFFVDPVNASASAISVIDLVCVLRC